MTVDTDQRVLHAAWDCLDSITKVVCLSHLYCSWSLIIKQQKTIFLLDIIVEMHQQ